MHNIVNLKLYNILIIKLMKWLEYREQIKAALLPQSKILVTSLATTLILIGIESGEVGNRLYGHRADK